jgi:AcrR family transcriptional regulator
MQVVRRTKQDVVAEFRSSEILGAARRVFARKGFAGASVDDVAEAAGLAKGTVYSYFPSKRDLYLAALHQGIAELIEETKRNVDAARTTSEKIRAFIAARIRYAETDRDFVAIYHAEFGPVHPASLKKEFKQLYQEQMLVLQAVIEEGGARGELRRISAEDAAFLVCEATRSFNGRRLLGWSRASADEDIDFLFELVWRGLAAVAETSAREKHDG